MSAAGDFHALIPDHRRDGATDALRRALGTTQFDAAQVLSGGVSGALILRLTTGTRDCVLRIEPERIARHHRERHFAAMSAAAEAGAAPAVHFCDADAGVCVMDFVAAQPLASHPGGPVGFARALGELLAKVRGAAPFTDFGSYPDLVGTLMAGLTASGRFPASELDACHQGLARIAGGLTWNEARASSHNDISPRNLLFDGARLWLVDWELAWLNDPLADLAIATTELAVGEALEIELLDASFGRAPDKALLARLAVTRLLTQLAYGAIVFDSLPVEPDSLANALTQEGFRRAVAEGHVTPGSRDIAAAFARMSLAEFTRGVSAADFADTLRRAADAEIPR